MGLNSYFKNINVTFNFELQRRHSLYFKYRGIFAQRKHQPHFKM